MNKSAPKIILILSLLITFPALAETILLKTGEKIEGNIVEKNDKYVAINFKGVIIPYHNFEIESIDGKSPGAIKNAYSDQTLQLLIKSQTLHENAGGTDVVTPEEYLQRGVAFYRKGEFDHAMQNFDSAIKSRSDYSEAYLYRGTTYMDKNDADKAIEDYNKAIESSPKGEEAYFVRGHAYFTKGNLDRAILDYNKAIEINPKYVQPYLNRALINMMKGSIEQAISDANKAIEIDPNIAAAHYILGLAYANGNNMKYAISEYTKAIKINPNYIEAYMNRGLAYAYNITAKFKGDPNSPNAYGSIGISLLDRKGFDHAIADCNKAIELSPKYAEAHLVRARVCILANNFDKAWADVHKAEELGGTVKPEFLGELERLSGRKK